jgi:hypothetical protein
MKVQIKDTEKGQAIVYLVIGLVVFLGFVALAIDGGMALADRRHAQNGADAASLAGGGAAAEYMEAKNVTTLNWDCYNNGNILAAIGQAENTAIQRAGANNFTIGQGIIDGNGTVAACGSTNYIGFTDHYLDVTVDISATTQSNFLQIIFPQALHSEVEAVARVRPRHPPAFGSAIVACNPDMCGGAGTPGGVFSGGGKIFLDGGGIFSNGCLNGNGGPTIVITDSVAMGRDLDPGNANWDPAPLQTPLELDCDQFNFSPPNCSDPAAHIINSGKLPNVPTVLDGLYCINGNLSINGNEEITGTNVTIYVPTGKLTINGTPTIHLASPPPDSAYPPAMPGVLIYLPPTNSNAVVMNGTEDSWFIGMLLAPSSTITLNGTGGNSYQGQVIGWNVNVGGTSDTYVIYHPEDGFTFPATIELAR